MLTVRLQFPAGRYHATPWGRHVNEGDVEWPPSPWRFLRALLATWHLKVTDGEDTEAVLSSLIDKLASESPLYNLPRATRAHTRHYMPVREGKADKPVLIFDAFARVDREDALLVHWEGVELNRPEIELLDQLLWNLGFLGRAESLVEAARVESRDDLEFNCEPGELTVEPVTGEVRETVMVLTPRKAADYREWRDSTLNNLAGRKLSAGKRKALEATLPETLLDALRLDTTDLKQVGWSQPPAGHWQTYQRPYACFAPEPRVQRRAGSQKQVQAVRLALFGKPLPRLENSVRIGELTRRALMSVAKRKGIDPPPVISGHGHPQTNKHGHAFYLPEDADGDGYIDHVLVYAEDGLVDALPLFERLTRLFDGGNGDWQVVVDGYGTAAEIESIFLKQSRQWHSVTPYLHPWHRKKRFGYVEQIQRECRERGLPEPQVEFKETVRVGRSANRLPLHFRRFRNKQGLLQPDRQGCFVTLTFDEPRTGPLAFGFGCHFGLGMFAPVED